MSLNFLQKSLTRLSESQTKYNTARSTEFVKYINKAVTDLSEVASQALENTEAAYNKYLKESNQPVSNEIKDLQNYTKNLSKKPLKLDIANSPEVNATLTEEIEKDNEEAYRLIKRSQNPFVNKKKKLAETNELSAIKNRFKVYKKDKDLINDLYSKAIEAEKNPDPNPTLLESRVHAELMDGSFKNNIVWNPVINGEKQLGGYYKDVDKLIKIEDLKAVNKVDLEFEAQMAEFVNDARKLAATGKWNEDSRREIISGMLNLAKSDPEKLRPIIFGGFTADKTEGAESAYATIWLDKLLADEKLTFVTPAQRDEMLDVLKGEDLTDAFLGYFKDFIDNNAILAMAANDKKPNVGKGGTKPSYSFMNEINAFIESYNTEGAQINIPGTTRTAKRQSDGRYLIYEKGNPVTLANQKPNIIEEKDLLTMGKGIPKEFRSQLKKFDKKQSGKVPALLDRSTQPAAKKTLADYLKFANEIQNPTT
tara:strand:- start:987 stop:2426 length:1440 start_codon:yes stop_codon:yes gene_type:complete